METETGEEQLQATSIKAETGKIKGASRARKPRQDRKARG
jgi:hypothetical protein